VPLLCVTLNSRKHVIIWTEQNITCNLQLWNPFGMQTDWDSQLVLCVCVCVCVCVRERVLCVCVCERERVLCVCVREREREKLMCHWFCTYSEGSRYWNAKYLLTQWLVWSQDMCFTQQCCCSFKSSGTWCCAAQVVPNILEDRSDFFISGGTVPEDF